MSRLGKSIATEEIFVDVRGWEMWEGRVIANGYEVSFWDDKNILKLDCGDGWFYNSVNIIKTPELPTLKRMNFMICEL